MNWLTFLSLLICLGASSLAQSGGDVPPPSKPSGCHVFIDWETIWTFEMAGSGNSLVPILNIITLSPGQWELRPGQIHIFNEQGATAEVERFSIETGAEPYVTQYMRVQGNSFIGIDLVGRFDPSFAAPARVAIDLGTDRFALESVDCLAFERLAERINQINFDSPDISEDFRVLGIENIGRRGPIPREERFR